MFIFPKIKILVLSAVALVAATVSGYAQQDTTRVVPAVDSLVKAQLPDSLKAAQPVDSLAAAKAADSLATVVPVVVPVSEGMPGQAGHDAKADAKSQTGQNGKAQQPDKQKDAKGQAQKPDKQKAAKEAAQPQQADIQTVRPVVDTLAKLPTLDTLARRPWVGIYAIWPHRRTLATEQIDTLYIRTPEEIRDSLRREAPAIGFNLAWAGIATPNLGAEFPVSENLTLGISAGLKPGPTFMKMDIVHFYEILAAGLWGCIFLLLLGLLIAPRISRVINIPKRILMPVVVVLCVIGAYACNRRPFDVVLMFFFGILGYLMRRRGFPTAPVTLGLVLGSMMDSNFRRSISLASTSPTPLVTLFGRPATIILLVLTLMTLLSNIPAVQRLLRRRGN